MSSLQNAPSWRRWVLRIAIAILVPVLLLGMIEAGLRAADVGFSAGVTVPCTIQGRSASCYNLFFAAPFFPPGMIKSPEAYAIPNEKPRNTFRIVVLGESAAMGDPDPAYAFSRYLEVMLRERFPSIKFEMVNTGSVAINSHVLLPIAQDLAQHHPDLFILYSGNNEVVGPYGAGSALTSSGMNLRVIRGSIFVRSTRIGQLLTKLGTQKQEWGGMEMFLDKQVRASSPLMKHSYENFESNLRDTIAVARASGARVIVSTIVTNLKDCAPFASLHREDMKQDALFNWSALVQQGSSLEDAQAYAEALRIYLLAETIDNEYAELEFRIARCLWVQGEYRAAKEHFLRARDLDTLRFRADTRINDINRSVASSFPGAELVDADEILAKESPNGIVGSELIYEHVHLTPLGNYLLARSMFLQIASKLAPEVGHSQEDAYVLSQSQCEQLLALTSHDRSRMAMEMMQRMEKPPFTTQLNHSDQVSRLMLTAGASGEIPDETMFEYQWAIAHWPEDHLLHYNYGRFLSGFNRNAAIQQFRMSRPWDGFPVFTPDGMIL
jgi:tetratricopeptide (TPR) repeat protein